jgi:glycosyltransferase involved in cell wall biosynthesis
MSRLMTFIHQRLSETANCTVDFLCEEDVPVRWKGRLSRFGFPALVYRKAREAAAQGKPYDIINVHEPSSAAIASFKRNVGNTKVVVTSYGIERRAWNLALEERRLGREGPSLKSRIIYPSTTLWQSSFGLRRADHVICSNDQDRDYLMNCLGLPPERITRMHSAASLDFADAARGRTYERSTQLLFAATWRKNKGIEDLVPAFTNLASRRPELRLTVLGGGVPEASILANFPEPIRGRLSCLQANSDEDTAACFARADIFLLPSLFEGTPVTLVEAMMSGLPIITTDTCGMKDVIRHEQNGLLIPMRSPEGIETAVERLMRDAVLRVRLGTQAQRDALSNYTWDAVAAPIGKMYRSLRDGHGA